MSTGHWLVSARFDLGLLIGPALLAAVILPAIAFVRESAAAMDAVRHNQYYRCATWGIC